MEIAISVFCVVVLIASCCVFWKLWQVSNAQEQLIIRLQVAHRQQVDELQATLKEKQMDIERLTEAVDLSTKTIENIHRSISDTSFDLIQSVRPVEKPAQVIRKAHNITAREVYGSIRKVNRLVGDLSRLTQSRSSKKESLKKDKD